MNFDEAITAHSQWKIRLQSFVAGTSKETLDPAIVGVDNKCVLGQWIYGEAKQYAGEIEYKQLLEEHARFHKCAAQVLQTSLAGKQQEAVKMLESGGEFHEISLKTINAIRHLKRKHA